MNHNYCIIGTMATPSIIEVLSYLEMKKDRYEKKVRPGNAVVAGHQESSGFCRCGRDSW